MAIAGCSIHPLPEDFSGVNTAQIVAKIRCEARAAVREFALREIELRNPDVAQKLRDRTLRFHNFNRRLLHPDTQRHFERYDHSAIAYEFTFDITETNDLTADADFLRQLSRGPFTLGVAAGNERQRQNTRNFRITDTFEGLATIVPEAYCPTEEAGPNWIYPMTGRVGLDELIGTFLTLHLEGNLSGTTDRPSIPAIADTIEFQTKFFANANPRIELSPVGNGFQLTKAGFKAAASRLDNHKMVVAVTLPEETRVVRMPGQRKAVRQSAKKRANEMIDYQLVRNTSTTLQELQRRLQVAPPR